MCARARVCVGVFVLDVILSTSSTTTQSESQGTRNGVGVLGVGVPPFVRCHTAPPRAVPLVLTSVRNLPTPRNVGVGRAWHAPRSAF